MFSSESEKLALAVQFLNKVLYAREGAKSIMDKTFADFPWQVRVEVDGVDIEVPEVSFYCLIRKLFSRNFSLQTEFFKRIYQYLHFFCML